METWDYDFLICLILLSKLKASKATELISLMKLHVVKCKTPYLLDGYTVRYNVLV